MSAPDANELKSRIEEIKIEVKEAAEINGRKFEDIKIIAVSKTHPIEYIYDAMEAGIMIFGENYAKELEEKHGIIATKGMKQPEWHFIGGLQKSNVKYIAPFVDMIHSVDSEKLLNEVDKRAKESDRIIDILLQINTSGEESKSGCEPDDIFQLVENTFSLKNVSLKGLMTIGTFTDDDEIRIREFSLLRESLRKINDKYSLNLKELSMGMSADYALAIREGATMVRIGTTIFGHRTYIK